MPWQVIIAALVGGATTRVYLWWWNNRHPKSANDVTVKFGRKDFDYEMGVPEMVILEVNGPLTEGGMEIIGRLMDMQKESRPTP